jgi:hypothetical protein
MQAKEFPELNHQKPLLRAFKYTTMVQGDEDEWVERCGFPVYLPRLSQLQC